MSAFVSHTKSNGNSRGTRWGNCAPHISSSIDNIEPCIERQYYLLSDVIDHLLLLQVEHFAFLVSYKYVFGGYSWVTNHLY